MASDELLVRAVLDAAQPMTGGRTDLDALVEQADGKHVVLIGEASHGTHEFYRLRAELTKRLITEKGFGAVAAEADWPDSLRVNRFVRGLGDDPDAVDALGGFERFPSWMWRNADVLDFVGWLRDHNDSMEDPRKVGFYGLDLYSLHASMKAVIEYLEARDKDAAWRARERYACFDLHGDDPQAYGRSTGFGRTETCQSEVVAVLIELQKRRDRLLAQEGALAEDDYFAAEMNACVVKDAEEYYRSMYRGRVSSWNLRDTHMADTLDSLLRHLRVRSPGMGRVVVWAHNSHVGDARATAMGAQGELNTGQLARERHPGHALLVGFSTHSGTVTAASDWGEPTERKRVRPALRGSYEHIFHQTGLSEFLLPLTDLGEAAGALKQERPQRAIGVIYRPETERMSHYYEVSLPRQFDAIIHVDHTRALEPLERTSKWDVGEPAETYPSGM